MGNFTWVSLCIHIHCFRGKALCTGCIKYDNSPNGRLEQEEHLFNVFVPLYFHKGWVKTLAARNSSVFVSGGCASPLCVCTGFTGPVVFDKGWSCSNFGTTRDGG